VPRRFIALRRFSFKIIVLALAPTLVFVLAGEAVLRMKYFFAHGHDWNYLTTPYVNGKLKLSGRMSFDAPLADDQIVFTFPRPCVSGMVLSTELKQLMPRTWDEQCFRGDRVSVSKPADEYRIVFLGGSTVQDVQSDDEMMTAQFKRAFPPVHAGKRTTVVNAGMAGLGSSELLERYQSKVARLSPDLVVYYEAWNEQPNDVKPRSKVDRQLSDLNTGVHRALHYRSMLYTYLKEKFAFAAAAKANFWKVDLSAVRTDFPRLARDVRARGGAFVFVTQVVNLPRTWKGIDTFDYHAVDALLDRLKADPAYVWDINEISMLNQRLALGYTLELCRENSIPVISLLDDMEALGDAKRGEMFVDLVHLSVKGDRFVGGLIANRLELPD
jgi:hypothetical protein